MAIKIKGSAVSGRTPLPADLLERQLAVNTADGYLFTKHSDGSVKDIKVKVADSATVASNCTGNSATVTNGVYTTGNQTVAGVKTFSSSPIAPTPTVGDDTTKLATTAFVKAKSEADSIGVGQTWQSFSSPDRQNNVTYTNSTGKPIVVSARSTYNGSQDSSIAITVNGLTVWHSNHSGYGDYNVAMGSAIVPNSSTYSIAGYGGSIIGWWELR
jgi:hypothetical protein